MIISLLVSLSVAADHGFGPLPPAPLPDILVTTEQGRQVGLRELTKDRAVALQFVFTDCVTACPLLGSLFRSIEKRLDGQDHVLMLSVSVNPGRDDPPRLKRWLDEFRRGPRWHAVRAATPDLESLLAVFGQKSGPAASHSTQVFLVKRNGDVLGRTTALPDAAGVTEILRRLQ